MPPLNDPKHEAFVRFVAQGKSKRDAAVAAGYQAKFASSQGSRLSKKANIGQRIKELQEQVAEKTVKSVVKLADLEIAVRLNRVNALEYRWQKIQQVIEERAADPSMAEIPGGKTGLIVRQIKTVGSGAGMKVLPEYVIDAGLLKELRAHEQQAAQELGQWVNKREVTGEDGNAIEINVNDVRERIESRIARLAAKLQPPEDSERTEREGA